MNSDQKYKNFVVKNFLSELKGYKLYHSTESLSTWWINDEKKEWLFELEYNGVLWWDESWGFKFIDKMALNPNDFREMIRTYVYCITKKYVMSDQFTDWGVGLNFYTKLTLVPLEIPKKGELENKFLNTILETVEFN